MGHEEISQLYEDGEMTKIKVLHIAPGFLYGGIESRLVDWYACMDRANIQFDVIKVTPDQPNSLVKQVEDMGGRVFSIPPLGAKTAFQHFKAVKIIMQATKYDVVHSHSLSYGFYPLFLAKRQNIPLRILHSRTTSYNPREKHILISTALGKLAIPIATNRFACSVAAGEWAFGSRSFQVINNGIFLDRFQFDESHRAGKRKELGIEGSFVLGYVGRFSSAKNVLFLLDVLQNVIQEQNNAVLIMVGEDQGEIAEQFKAKADKLKLSDHLIYAGRQDQTQMWYSAFDVFLLPSLFEGFGTVAIEAQASGLPCVVSTGVPESVKVSDRISFLDLDDPAAWADKILEYYHCERLPGDIAGIRDAGYDVRTTAKELERLYCSMPDS